jgi:hypothetical protein
MRRPPELWPDQPVRKPALAWRLLTAAAVTEATLIGIQYARAGSRRIPVLLFRNAGGSFSGHCLLSDHERAVIDSGSAESVMEIIADVLELSLEARGEAVR